MTRARSDETPLSDRSAIEAAAFVMSLRARGVRDTALLSAMERTSRESFAPRRLSDLARRDVALPLACGQTMTAPGTVAAMLVALGLRPGQRVLEIGTGSGYVTALLVRLGAEVVSVERYRTLAEAASLHLAAAGALDAVTLLHGDGLAPGLEGSFDRVLLNGFTRDLPPDLTARLAPGGRLVGALGGRGGPRLLTLEREADGALRREVGAPLRLAPLAEGRAVAL